MDDIYYLIHVIPKGTKLYEIYDRETKQPNILYKCEDFIDKYGGILRTGNHILPNGSYEDFPGVYTTIIHKYNLNKMLLFYYSVTDACVVILSKTLLLQRNYHINAIDGFGAVSDLFTFFPWELDKFIAAQKLVSDNHELQLNEAVFHHDINLHEYCCDIMPIENFKKRSAEIDYDAFNSFKERMNPYKLEDKAYVEMQQMKKFKKQNPPLYKKIFKLMNKFNGISSTPQKSEIYSTTALQQMMPSSLIRTSDIHKPHYFNYENGTPAGKFGIQYQFRPYEHSYPTTVCEKGPPDMSLEPHYSESLKIDITNIFPNQPIITREFVKILQDGAPVELLKAYTTDPNNPYNNMKNDLIYVYLVAKPWLFNIQPTTCKGIFAAIEHMYEQIDGDIITKYKELKPMIDLLYQCNNTTTLCTCPKDSVSQSRKGYTSSSRTKSRRGRSRTIKKRTTTSPRSVARSITPL